MLFHYQCQFNYDEFYIFDIINQKKKKAINAMHPLGNCVSQVNKTSSYTVTEKC